MQENPTRQADTANQQTAHGGSVPPDVWSNLSHETAEGYTSVTLNPGISSRGDLIALSLEPQPSIMAGLDNAVLVGRN